MGSSSYKATGTIRIRYDPPKTASRIFFTPHADSTLRQDGKQYAMFSAMTDAGGTARGVILPDSGVEIEIGVKADHAGLLSAVAREMLVEVEVVKRKSKWELKAITVPAPNYKK